jgi:Zn-dependent protease
MGKYTLATIGGVPLVIDASLVLLVALWLMPDVQSGSVLRLSMGGLVLMGVLFSILLHELAHSAAGRYFGVATSHIELNAMGGLCFYAGLMPRSCWQRIVMILAGPAMTWLVWRFCVSTTNFIDLSLENGTDSQGLEYLNTVLWRIGTINYYMLLFNLLPAFPLDGGKALKELIAIYFDPYKANWVVSWLGMASAVYCALLGLQFGTWMFVMAVILFVTNYEVWKTETRAPWQRWN